MNDSNKIYDFGSLRLYTRTRQLFRDSAPVALTPKCFDLLKVLVENRDRALSKSELLAALWPDAQVEEGNLTFQISALRKALGPTAGKWIETVPRHGYRFNGPVDVREVPIARRTTLVTARRLPLYLILAGIAALGAMLYPARRSGTLEDPVGRPLPLTTFVGSEIAASWSPDGKQIAFVWNGTSGDNRDIYLKREGTEQPLRLPPTPT